MTPWIWLIVVPLVISFLVYTRVTIYWFLVYRRTSRRIVYGMTMMAGLIALISLLRLVQIHDGLEDRRFHTAINIVVAIIMLLTSLIQYGIIRGRFNRTGGRDLPVGGG